MLRRYDRKPSCMYASLKVHSQYGLIGSTEFAEDFPDYISKHVVAYVNLGASVYERNRTVSD